MRVAKKMFHLFPPSVQRPINCAYERGRNVCNYYVLHRPIEKRVQRIFASMGLKGIKKVSRWRTEPIFSQYYTAELDEKKVFCKVYKKPDFGCINREERTLRLISRDGSYWLKEHSPSFVMAKYCDDIEIIVTEYIDGHELSGNDKDIDGLFEQMVRILQEQKSLGIVHADVRPLNFLVRPNGDIVLIDYGLAYVKRFKAEDELYSKMKYPKALWGTGCNVYTIKNGMFDDAYAVLKSLKEIEPKFIRKHHDKWLKLNDMIGKEQIVVEKMEDEKE